MHLFLSFANLLPCVFCLSRTEIPRGRENIFSICFIRSMPEFPLHTKNWSLELIFPGQVLVPYTPECQMVGVVRQRKRKQSTFHFSRRGVEQHRTLYSGHSWNVWKCNCNFCQVLQLILCICTPVVRLSPLLSLCKSACGPEDTGGIFDNGICSQAPWWPPEHRVTDSFCSLWTWY